MERICNTENYLNGPGEFCSLNAERGVLVGADLPLMSRDVRPHYQHKVHVCISALERFIRQNRHYMYLPAFFFL